MNEEKYVVHVCPDHRAQLARGDQGQFLCRNGHEVENPISVEAIPAWQGDPNVEGSYAFMVSEQSVMIMDQRATIQRLTEDLEKCQGG